MLEQKIANHVKDNVSKLFVEGEEIHYRYSPHFLCLVRVPESASKSHHMNDLLSGEQTIKIEIGDVIAR